MNGTNCFCRVNSRFVAPVTAVLLLAGCSSTRTLHCGDARVRETHVRCSLMATMPFHYQIELPEIRLGTPGTQRFQIRELAGFVHPDELHLRLPQHDVTNHMKAAPVLPWENAVLNLSAFEPEGQPITNATLRLGDLAWVFYKQNRILGWHAAAKIPGLRETLARRRDYDLTLTVQRPSLRASDEFNLQGPSDVWHR